MKYTTKMRVLQAATGILAAAAVTVCSIPAKSVELPEPSSRTVAVDLPLIRGYQVIPASMRQEREIDREAVVARMSAKMARAEAYVRETAEPEEEPERVYLGRYRVTGYDTCARCCGNTNGITASGTTATVGRTCAAPKDIPFGTVLWIEGIGERVVEDRGSAVHGNVLDVLCADHKACFAITGNYDVYIVEG